MDVTELIAQARAGDAAASGRLFNEVYGDLRALAARQVVRMRADMRATSLVHEAWFRLAKPESLALKDREHFFAVAARAMRQLVIDHARQRVAGKRGGGAIAAELDSQIADAGDNGRDQELLALDQALRQLEALDPHLAALVEMRFFGGLELAEISTLTARSERSLKRDWRKARAFLHQQLGGDALPDGED
ncbi:MAG TPA: ECF-type sigma factor [Tahibacter sp.]|uniref:ECF-type sigma factor n=1 Tax=Tahibacter sp. TaxID=2056211 RepID=UPI002BAE8410|nr:ECF-type sigma factor [Tahibacter sp.]HSX60112.1 ECF-type sigma factor [Tahibacter sp.]